MAGTFIIAFFIITKKKKTRDFVVVVRQGLCSPGHPGTQYIHQIDLKLAKMCQALLSECWDEGHTAPYLAGMFKYIVGCFLKHLGIVLKVYLERWCKFGQNRTMHRAKTCCGHFLPTQLPRHLLEDQMNIFR